MANSATCWLEIKCSDNKALLEELKRRGYVESVYDDKKDEASDESEVDGICLDFPATGLCTGAGDCCLAKEGNDTLGFNGGMKWEFKITNEDIKVLKEAAAAVGITLKSVCGWGEVQENLNAFVWPAPKWMKQKWPKVYEDAVVRAYMITIIKEDEYYVDDEEYDIGYFMDTASEKLLQALISGENTFSEEWYELFPDCFNIDVPVSEDEYQEGEMFEWDWS